MVIVQHLFWESRFVVSAWQHVNNIKCRSNIHIKVILCLTLPTKCTWYVPLAENIFFMLTYQSFCKPQEYYMYNYQSAYG